jgi:hypothetical protein
MLGLRLTSGIAVSDELSERAKRLPPEYVSVKEGKLMLTAKGFLISNTIIADLLL